MIHESWDARDAYTGGLSDCCGAPVMVGDICADCGEHCGVQPEDEGDVELEEVPHSHRHGHHGPHTTFESFLNEGSGQGKNSLKDLVGKDDEEELDLDDARKIGKKISKMTGDDRKKYVGIVNFMGASCRLYNEIWANYKPVDPEKKKANRGKEFRGDKEIG